MVREGPVFEVRTWVMNSTKTIYFLHPLLENQHASPQWLLVYLHLSITR